MSAGHQELVQRSARWLAKTRGCGSNVFTEMSTGAWETPDVIGWRYGISTVVEVKVSRADFLSDKKKAWRVSPEQGLGAERYYCVPPGLISESDLPPRWGLVEAGRVMRIIRRAERFVDYNRIGEIVFLTSMLRRISVRLRCDPNIYISREPFKIGEQSDLERPTS